jgi:CBS domain-containing protein
MALTACQTPEPQRGGGAADVPQATTPPVPPTSAPPTDSTSTPVPAECPQGEVSFVTATTLAVLGRRPLSRDEVNAGVQVVATDGAEAFVLQLAAQPEFLPRWTELLMDHLRVQRADLQSQIDCYGVAARSEDAGALAAYVRDNAADSTGDGLGVFTARDLLRSSLELDDLVPALRGHLFAMMNVPIRSCNLYSGVQAELQRRADFGSWFDAAYLNRDADCLSCHNSEWAVTYDADPALNRHWALPGPQPALLEKALFGVSDDMSAEQAHAIFRYDGLKRCEFPNVCTEYPYGPGARTPWGWSANACGDFYLDDLPPDATEVVAQFGSLAGEVTVYDLDAVLKRGAEVLAADGLLMDAAGNVSDPDAAFAYLVSANIVEFVWTEVVGTSLTIANRFPRNEESRDQLAALTDTFVSSGYSLRSLLAAIVVTPWFNPVPPSAGCGAAPYTLDRVYDPWTIGELDPTKQPNSAADGVQPLSARTLLSATYAALGQGSTIKVFFPGGPYAPDYLTEQDQIDTEFLSGIGAYMSSGATGFRGLGFQARLMWEQRFGGCPEVGTPDYIDLLMDQVATSPDATVRDVVLALKDRILAEPFIDDVLPDESSLLEGLFGSALDAPASSVPDLEDRSRRYCGVLIQSPQFQLSGLASNSEAETPMLNSIIESSTSTTVP